jgi:hypothetical protein
MLKALFWLVVGLAGTLLFAGIMLFVFGQSDRLECRHAGDGQANCAVTHVLLWTLPLPGWQANGINQALVEESCDSDGCTYRTALRARGGASHPITEVWSDQRATYQDQAAQINDFLADGSQPPLIISQDPPTWVLLLLGGLTLMAIVIQGVVFLAQGARAVFGGR